MNLPMSPVPGGGAPRILQNTATLRCFGGSASAGLAANAWWGSILASPVPFYAVRLGFVGQSGQAARNIAAAWVQTIEDPTAAQPFVGVMSDSYASRLTNQVTFNGAGADQPYPGTSGSTTALTIAAGPTLPQEQILYYSDWYQMPNGAYPSKIGGTVFDGFYYLGVMLQAGTNGLNGWATAQSGDFTGYLNSPLVTGSNSFHIRDAVTGSAAPVEFSTWSISGKASLGTAAENMYLASIDFMTPGRVLNVACLADSQLAGWDANSAPRPTTDQLGGVQRACLALSTPGLPITYVNMANPGWSFANWINTFAPSLGNSSAGVGVLASTGLILPSQPPDVLFLQYASANDNGAAPTGDTLKTGYNTTMEIVRWCRRNGIVPVICTVPPASGRYPNASIAYWHTTEQVRCMLNQGLRAQAAANQAFYLLDTDAIVANSTAVPATGAAANAIQSAYAQGDGIHFSDAGNIAIGSAVSAILQTIKATG